MSLRCPHALLHVFLVIALAILSAGLGCCAAQAQQPRASITIVPQIGHSRSVSTLAFLPDGKVIASGSSDGSIKLWDVETGALLRTLAAHDSVRSVAISADGRRMVSAGDQDQRLTIWDTSTWTERRSLKQDGLILAVAISSDSERLALADETGLVTILQLGSGNTESTERPWSPSGARTSLGAAALSFTPDARMLLVGGDRGLLKLLDAKTGRTLRTAVAALGRSRFGDREELPIRTAVVSPDGKRAALGGLGAPVRLWDLANWRALGEVKALEDAEALRFGDGGRTLAAAIFERRLSIVDLDGRTPPVTYSHDTPVSALAASFDTRSFASVSDKGQLFVLRQTGESRAGPPRVFRLDANSGGSGRDEVARVTVSPQGGAVTASYAPGPIMTWEIATGRPAAVQIASASTTSAFAYAPDGRAAFLAWSEASGTGHLAAQPLGESGAPDGWVTTTASLVTAILPYAGGRRLALAEGLAGVTVRDGATGERLFALNPRQHPPLAASGSLPSKVSSLDVTPDGAHLVTGGGAIGVWDAATGRLTRWIVAGAVVNALRISPDGALVAAAMRSGEVAIARFVNGDIVKNLDAHDGEAMTVAFSPDGTRVATGGQDGRIAIWRTADWQIDRVLAGHAGAIASVSFTPDGRRLVSGGKDQTVRVWDPLAGTLLASLVRIEQEWVALTPEGFFDASSGAGRRLLLVDGLRPFAIDQLYDALYRPDLVFKKLAGDPDGDVARAAAQLDLTRVIASGAAPRVAILPRTASAYNQGAESVTIEAEIEDRGGGIGRIEWRVNGITLGVNSRGLGPDDTQIPSADAPRRTVRRQAVALQRGDNIVDVRAYNAAGLVASEPAVIRLRREGEPIQPRLFVLAVGIDLYDDEALRLAFAGADARMMGEAMRRAGGTLYRSVEVVSLLDKEVTASSLDIAFGRLAGRVTSDDVFLFYVAGHAKTIAGRYFFLPRDFRYENTESIVRTGIGQDRWQEWLRRIPAQKSLLLFDTCESGSLTADTVARRGLEEKTALELLTRATGRTTLAAAAANGPAIEGYRGHGVFTYAILDAIEHGDLNRDGYVDLDELILHVNATVPAISQQAFRAAQYPQVARNGANFPLASQIKALAPRKEDSVPRRPTHVVLAPAALHPRPGDPAPAQQELTPGTLVTMIEAEGSPVLVAREGRVLGYVARDKLAPIQ